MSAEKSPEQKEQQAIAVRASVAMTANGVSLANLDDLYRFAQYVAASPFAPKDFKDPVSIVVAVQYGFELGLSPMAALQNIAVINGRPSVYGDVMLALVRASGLLENIRETVTGEGDKMVATCVVKRFGEDEHEEVFSMQDAILAKLPERNPTYKTYPKRMLKFRARGFALRDKFGDVLKGLISREEAMDMGEDKPAPRPVVSLKDRLKAGTEAGQPIDAIDADEIPSPPVEPEPSDALPFDAPDARESLLADVQSLFETFNVDPTPLLKNLKAKKLGDLTDEQLRQIVAESATWQR